MKIQLPEHIGEITLEQYQRYNALIKREDLSVDNFNKRKIEIFTGLKIIDVTKIQLTDYDGILKQIDDALSKDVGFEPFFKMKGVEFGFIPNFDKITAGEYRDLLIYNSEIDTMHNLMAILFRPIKDKDVFGNYVIEPYRGTEQYANLMKQMPLNIVTGALVFFSNLANELVSYTQRFTEAEQMRER